jgi:hypothetical protein
MNDKKARWKLLAIVCVGVVLKVIQLPFLEDPLAEVFPLRMIKNVAVTPLALILIILSYLFFSMIFIAFQSKINGNKVVKGFVYGTLFGVLWFYGMIEMAIIHHTSFTQEIVYGLGDALPFVIMGILLGMFFGSSSNSEVVSIPFKKHAVSIMGMAIIYVIGRYFSYMVIGGGSSYIDRPVETFAWTLGNGLLIGILYYFMKGALHHYPLFKRAVLFGLVIFGMDWFIYNLFVPIIYDIPLLDMVQSYVGRSIPDILFVCVGVFGIEKALKP